MPNHDEYDNNSDEYGFWNDAPARRRHGDSRAIPVVSAAAPDPAGVRAGTESRHIDPLIRRVGALAIVITMCVPVALSLRGKDSSAAAMRPDTSSAVVTPALGEPAAQPDATAPQTLAAPSAPQTSAPTANAAAPAARVGAASAQTAPTQPEPVSAVVTVAGCTKEYPVVAGDYWILIAKKVSVGVNELLSANNATTDTALYPGRTICLPANASTPTTASPATTAAPVTRAPATTAAPATTHPPATTVPARTSYTRAEVEAIIREIWPDDLENDAVRIATRESNLVPTAKNFCCYGLFQIYWNVHKGWLAGIGVTSSQQLFDPRVNAWAALVLYNRSGGWGPWT